MTGTMPRLGHFLRRTLLRAPTPIQDAARKGAASILSALGPRDEPDHDSPSPCWETPPLPVPDGLTVDQLETSFRSWSVNGDSPGALDPYVDDSMWRFLHTWGMVRHDAGRCLEVGSNPYFTTFLLEEYTKLDVTLSNFY